MKKKFQFLKLPFARPETINFFRNIVHSTIKNRQINNITRHDLIDLLMKVKTGTLSHEIENNETSETGFATVEESSIGKQKNNRRK